MLFDGRKPAAWCELVTNFGIHFSLVAGQPRHNWFFKLRRRLAIATGRVSEGFASSLADASGYEKCLASINNSPWPASPIGLMNFVAAAP